MSVFQRVRTMFLAASLFVFPVLRAQTPPAPIKKTVNEKTLSFRVGWTFNNKSILYYNAVPHSVTYFHDAHYDAAAIREISDIMRDRSSNEPLRQIDKGLLDLLYDLKTKLEEKQPGLPVVFGLISGNRTSATNAKLRRLSPYRDHIALDSMHMYGRAADIFVEGLKPGLLLQIAWCMGKGSVGIYPDIKFPEDYIHFDSRDLLPGVKRAHWGFDPPSCAAKDSMLTAEKH